MSEQALSRSPRSPRPHLWPSDMQNTPLSQPPQNQVDNTPVSTASDSPFHQLTSEVTDRVFPIRSVVSVDPNPTPFSRAEGGDGFPGMIAPHERNVRTSQSPDRRRFSSASALSVDQASDLSTAETPNKPKQGQDRASPADTGAGSLSGPRRGPGPTSVATERSASTKQYHILSDTSSMKSGSIASLGEVIPSTSRASSVKSRADKDYDTGGGVLTARFKHVVAEGGHAIITGRDGDTLQRCEDEPIHIPGAVQGFGLLIALHEEVDGKLTVRVVSENSKRIVGYTPRQLFALDSFCDILSAEQVDNLLDHLDFIRDGDADPGTNGPEVFTLSIRPPGKRSQKLWCAMHINDSNPDMILCEFELEEDHVNPLVPLGEEVPEAPEDTLSSDPTAEEYAESTLISSKPLRVLRSARKRKGEAAAMEVFNIMSQVQEQLASAKTLDQFLKVLVGVVKELTGFHRVMVYQFDQEWNGRVVTELVDPRATKDLYKGLNFPASDIPKQARDLYKINKVRLLYDRDLETARLVCRTVEDLETPLDLSFSYLRAMSPVHIKYLANMAVRGSMSISINAFNELWGLIACHSYGSKGMRVSFPIRKMCRLIGDTASRNIERLSYASRLQARKLINTASTQHNPSGYIVASSDDLLTLFDADFGVLSIRGETKFLGKSVQSQEALAMLEYLRLRQINSVTTSNDIKVDFPDLRYPPGFSVIAGLLLVPLSEGGQDFICFFRQGQTKEVKWAGNPYEKFLKEGTEGYLEPRKSFKTWSEIVVGKCREWTEEQIETAAVLCLVYGKFINVWRQKEEALQSSQLTKLLLANSAHEVRTPLNAIINYLEIALEGSLDHDTRENLAKSHSASKSLIYVINDLLDLTKTEEGGSLTKDELFDLRATIKEATDSFTGDAKRKHIDYEVIIHPGIPPAVIGDQRRVRQAVSNVTANAIQHTTKGGVKVELEVAARTDERVEVDIAIQDTGVGMSSQKLDALFRELEQVQGEDGGILEETFDSDSKRITSGKEEKKTLGLGLAVVSRIIRNMDGQLRLKSEEGKGSRFVIQLPFSLPAEPVGQPQVEYTGFGLSLRDSIEKPTTPPATEGEVMLIPKGSTQKPQRVGEGVMTRKKSTESVESVNTFKSQGSNRSAKSDVDRLIDAIQEPHMVHRSQTRPTSSASHHSGPVTRRQLDGTGLGSPQAEPGEEPVKDSKTSLKGIKVPDDDVYNTLSQSDKRVSRVLFEIPHKPDERTAPPTADHLQVLVAEDDPVNSRIIKKRLEKIGHDVFLTINGEECSSAYGEKPGLFDVVLMDMQMPIVDGLTSTKMIRSFEKSHPSNSLSPRAAFNGRVPIFAVSASLIEKDRQTYVDAGFDGWILKPVDFKRLSVLLSGIVEESTRAEALYQPGAWEKGGWLSERQPDVFAAATAPSQHNVVGSRPKVPCMASTLSVDDSDHYGEEEALYENFRDDATRKQDRERDRLKDDSGEGSSQAEQVESDPEQQDRERDRLRESGKGPTKAEQQVSIPGQPEQAANLTNPG
ncbi:MAG: Light-sensor Protein kinase [Candelina mexicana]|nr:MAG: Light-sensor Protein kinase [Candelina mexicana]